MSKEILLSICIPTYNREMMLNNQLHRLYLEGVFDSEQIEVIVSNNCSSDNTKEILKNYASFKNTTIINQDENLGSEKNIIILSERANGKYTWFVSDDDILPEGFLMSVMNAIYKNPEAEHFFINFSEIYGDKIISEKKYKGKTEIFEDGFEMFEEISRDCGFGAMMFMTSNIYLNKSVGEALSILRKHNENINYALPLAFSLYCSKGKGVVINDVQILDQVADVSWRSDAWLVWCRDMVSVLDIISCYIGKDKEVFTLLQHCLPFKYPELLYIVKGKRYAKDNYALKLYMKKHKIRLFFDIIEFPFYCMTIIFKKLF